MKVFGSAKLAYGIPLGDHCSANISKALDEGAIWDHKIWFENEMGINGSPFVLECAGDPEIPKFFIAVASSIHNAITDSFVEIQELPELGPKVALYRDRLGALIERYGGTWAVPGWFLFSFWEG